MVSNDRIRHKYLEHRWHITSLAWSRSTSFFQSSATAALASHTVQNAFAYFCYGFTSKTTQHLQISTCFSEQSLSNPTCWILLASSNDISWHWESFMLSDSHLGCFDVGHLPSSRASLKRWQSFKWMPRLPCSDLAYAAYLCCGLCKTKLPNFSRHTGCTCNLPSLSEHACLCVTYFSTDTFKLALACSYLLQLDTHLYLLFCQFQQHGTIPVRVPCWTYPSGVSTIWPPWGLWMKLLYFRSFGTKLSLRRLHDMLQSSATSLATLEYYMTNVRIR